MFVPLSSTELIIATTLRLFCVLEDLNVCTHYIKTIKAVIWCLCNNNTHYVALALPWTLTVIRGIQVPRYSNAAWVVRLPLTPPVPGPPCAVPCIPEPDPPESSRQKQVMAVELRKHEIGKKVKYQKTQFALLISTHFNDIYRIKIHINENPLTSPGILNAEYKGHILKLAIHPLLYHSLTELKKRIWLFVKINWPAGALTAAVLALGTMKRDWMKEPRALTMSLNTLVECCFMSYDWQNDLKKEINTRGKQGTGHSNYNNGILNVLTPFNLCNILLTEPVVWKAENTSSLYDLDVTGACTTVVLLDFVGLFSCIAKPLLLYQEVDESAIIDTLSIMTRYITLFGC